MKNCYYFSHDSNARTDEKVLKLRSKHNAKGYGIYFMLIEMLHDANENKLQCDFDAIAYEVREKPEDVQDIIENFGLFEIKDGFFWSNSLKKRMEMKNIKSEKARQSANIRWQNANAMRTQCDSNAIKERKGKEIYKEKIYKKEKNISPKRKLSENVEMTEDEYNKLIVEHGEANARIFIEILNNYKGANGKKYKSDYLAILNWVIDKTKKDGKYKDKQKEKGTVILT